ncbi:MAG TPA: helix-turn-helix domain-containing protein [Chloroflexota bacterium]
MDPVKPKRPYRSRRRERQAEDTRAAILDAAQSLFVHRGFAATTMETIAQEADVAVQTVYWAFGSKRAILQGILDRWGATAEIDSTYLALMAESDPMRQLRLSVRISRNAGEKAGEVTEMLRMAGAADAELRVLWHELNEDRRNGIRGFIQTLADRDLLKQDLEVERATTIHWTMVSQEVYHLLVTGSGWTGDEYEDWLTEALVTLLLR